MKIDFLRIERTLNYPGDDLVWRAYFNTHGKYCWSFEHKSLLRVIEELLVEIRRKKIE